MALTIVTTSRVTDDPDDLEATTVVPDSKAAYRWLREAAQESYDFGRRANAEMHQDAEGALHALDTGQVKGAAGDAIRILYDTYTVVEGSWTVESWRRHLHKRYGAAWNDTHGDYCEHQTARTLDDLRRRIESTGVLPGSTITVWVDAPELRRRGQAYQDGPIVVDDWDDQLRPA